MHFARCTCKMHFARCTLQDALCKMHFARCTLQDALCKMHFARCTVQDALCKMHFARCTLNNNVFCNRTCYVGVGEGESCMILFPQGRVGGRSGDWDGDYHANPRPINNQRFRLCARRWCNCYEARLCYKQCFFLLEASHCNINIRSDRDGCQI